MGTIAGVEVPISVDITGWLSNSWVWVGLVAFLGFFLIVGAGILVFYMTYNRKIIIHEEINGNLQPILQTRARVIKLRAGGEEVMKTLFGNYYVSAYSKRYGKKTYLYLRGTDGYLYNFTLDNYAKPKFIEGDMRMFNIAIDRLSQQTYGKQGFLEKYAVHMLLFVFLVTLIIGMWFIVSEIGKATQPLAQSTDLALEISKAHDATILKLDNLLRSIGNLPESINSTGGLIPAT